MEDPLYFAGRVVWNSSIHSLKAINPHIRGIICIYIYYFSILYSPKISLLGLGRIKPNQISWWEDSGNLSTAIIKCTERVRKQQQLFWLLLHVQQTPLQLHKHLLLKTCLQKKLAKSPSPSWNRSELGGQCFLQEVPLLWNILLPI